MSVQSTAEKEILAFPGAIDLLGPPVDPELEEIVQAVGQRYEVENCTVTLVDDDSIALKASFSVLSGHESPFLRGVIAERNSGVNDFFLYRDLPIIIRDVLELKDARSGHIMNKLNARFYAVAPIILSPGVRIGGLAIFDSSPRPHFSRQDTGHLVQQAKRVADILAVRQNNSPIS